MNSLLESQGLSLNPSQDVHLSCPYNRSELIARIGLLAETHLTALKDLVEPEVFTNLCSFPVELIGETVNGYQRFLADISGGASTAQIIAGMILRFRAAIVYELGPVVLKKLETEMIGLNTSQVKEAVGTGDKDSLWTTTHPTMRGTEITRDWDLLSTFLFISHAKWLLVRATAAQAETDTKK